MANRAAGERADPATTKTLDVIERQTEDVRESARGVRRATAHVESSAERTTRLAADRTVLAAERTYAAWVRTGLFAFASGIGARALLNGLVPDWVAIADSFALVAFSVFCFGAAVWRELRPGPPPPEPRVRQLPRAMLIALNAFLAAVALAAGIGILAGGGVSPQ
jgi:putative membrane protein